jgi:hypothetical protein
MLKEMKANVRPTMSDRTVLVFAANLRSPNRTAKLDLTGERCTAQIFLGEQIAKLLGSRRIPDSR